MLEVVSLNGDILDENELKTRWIKELKNDNDDSSSLVEKMDAYPFEVWVGNLISTGKYFELLYFEIELRNTKDLADEYSMCIKTIKRPTFDETKEFLKEDMEKFGYDNVSSIIKIDKEEAFKFFDMENESNFPILGLSKK